MGIGLVLSGGGSKGAAHIGVIKALKEEKIDIDYISGTSSGSIIASLYAMGYSSSNMYNIFKKYCSYMTDVDRLLPFKILGSIFNSKLCVKGICKGKALENTIQKYCVKKNVYDISDIKIPIAIPTVDVRTGEVIYFLNKKVYRNDNMYNNKKLYDDNPTCYYNGKISSIVRASCSLPAVFIPKNINGHMLIDGGVRMNTPISILKLMGAKNILAVTFDNNKERIDKCDNIISITMQSFDIMCHQVNQEEMKLTNYIIRPNVEKVSTLGCDKIDTCIKNGYNETKRVINRIKNNLS